MINNPSGAKAPFSLLHDCSSMDASIVERLRATVEISLEWADQTLDILIQLDADLHAYGTMVKQQSDSHLALGEGGNLTLGIEEIVRRTDERVLHLRNGVRDIMMSMQNQDVIGQAMERAASALEKRAAALGRIVEGFDVNQLHTNEIAELHHTYRTNDDLHRATGLDETEYNAAA